MNFCFLSDIGHFTALVTDRTTEVGCSLASEISVIDGTDVQTYFIACNYASTNIPNWPVYKSGPAASACVGGADIDFPGLCKDTESINANLNDN
jgi:hypothetical protein